MGRRGFVTLAGSLLIVAIAMAAFAGRPFGGLKLNKDKSNFDAVIAATIQFSLAEPGQVDLSVFDVSGRRVASLVRESMPEGEHSVIWSIQNGSGRRVVPGVYFYRLEVDGAPVAEQRLVVAR